MPLARSSAASDGAPTHTFPDTTVTAPSLRSCLTVGTQLAVAVVSRLRLIGIRDDCFPLHGLHGDEYRHRITTNTATMMMMAEVGDDGEGGGGVGDAEEGEGSVFDARE